MDKIALLVDSTCGLPQEYIEKYNIKVARLKVIYKSSEYIDGIDITPDAVYSRLQEELPTTSMPSVTDVCNIYEDVLKEGYTHVIALPISSGLSGTINSFRLAAEEYEDKLTSFVFDTKVLSMAVGLIAIEVAKLIEAKKDFNFICDQIPKLREKTSMYFTVNTLEYLIKGGRIGRVSGGIGEMLNLKPIITMGDDGKYVTETKVRGTKQAVNKLLKIATSTLDKGKGKVIVMTGTMFDEANHLMEILKEHKNTTFIHQGILTPVVGIHSGPEIVAVAVMEEI